MPHIYVMFLCQSKRTFMELKVFVTNAMVIGTMLMPKKGKQMSTFYRFSTSPSHALPGSVERMSKMSAILPH